MKAPARLLPPPLLYGLLLWLLPPCIQPNGHAGVGATSTETPGPVELVIERHGTNLSLFGDNPLAGPVEILLSPTAATVAESFPPLPQHRVMGARRRELLARAVETGQAAGFVLDSVPGDPLAEPQDVAYSLPLDSQYSWEVGQGFHGDFSHDDEANRYAIDLIVDEGTPVLAARGGVVMQVHSGYDDGGTSRQRYLQRANQIRILHDDGSMAVYAHLRENGVLVTLGERVGLGQAIGISGNTGYSSGPHLHFCVQVNRGMRLVSIPFRMVGPQGFLPMEKPW